MEEKRLSWEACRSTLPPELPAEEVDPLWQQAVATIQSKIIVLDDDPTGIQTVHSIPVYTDWGKETLQQVLADPCRVIYILTNSRALNSKETEALHRCIARGLLDASKTTGTSFIVMSRSDSTLRGHYPLETACLYEELRQAADIDAEIITPFFLEGGRITIDDVHYVKDGDVMIPAGQTEFARDEVFGYASSNLKEWVEEKTGGKFTAADVTGISLDSLRARDVEGIVRLLSGVRGFRKVIVNAATYEDLKVFVIAVAQAISQGHRFLFRTAAGLVQMLGGIEKKPLLKAAQLFPTGKIQAPGLIMIGSYVQKTTKQFEKLKEMTSMDYIEFNVMAAASVEQLADEVRRVLEAVETAFINNRDACVFTSRIYHKADSGNEGMLDFSNRVSKGLVSIVRGLKTRPGFLVAKGGITSSDIGVKGLDVRRAMVMGQILPGIPVWELGGESRFPGLPYVIFPGNVGNEDALKQVVEILKG